MTQTQELNLDQRPRLFSIAYPVLASDDDVDVEIGGCSGRIVSRSHLGARARLNLNPPIPAASRHRGRSPEPIDRSQVAHHEDARSIDSGSAHGAEPSTDDRWIQAKRIAMTHVTEIDVARALDGDRDALTRLVERVRSPVYRLALRFFGNRSDAEDASQEA